MKTLLVLRHAKAENPASGMSDFDRALNERGRRQAQACGEFVKNRDLKVDLVLSSPALRARETSESLKSVAGLNGDIRFDQRIYEASSHTLFELLSEIDEAASPLMLVGHNPGLEDLIHMLTGRAEHLSPATIAKISFAFDQWNQVEENTGVLDWVCNQTNSPLTDRVPGIHATFL